MRSSVVCVCHAVVAAFVLSGTAIAHGTPAGGGGKPLELAQAGEDDAGIRSVITAQLEALKRGDGEAAFAIASPAIQEIMQDVPAFMALVAKGYPQLLQSNRHRFLKLERVGGTLVERVMIESDKGSVVARYEMIEIDGHWRINGCTLEERQDA